MASVRHRSAQQNGIRKSLCRRRNRRRLHARGRGRDPSVRLLERRGRVAGSLRPHQGRALGLHRLLLRRGERRAARREGLRFGRRKRGDDRAGQAWLRPRVRKRAVFRLRRRHALLLAGRHQLAGAELCFDHAVQLPRVLLLEPVPARGRRPAEKGLHGLSNLFRQRGERRRRAKGRESRAVHVEKAAHGDRPGGVHGKIRPDVRLSCGSRHGDRARLRGAFEHRVVDERGGAGLGVPLSDGAVRLIP